MTQPNAHELLEIARQTLLKQLLPALSTELRYSALMIANAMAIADRESRLQARVCSQEQELLGGLIEGAGSSLPDTRRQLAQEIRQGRHDATHQQLALVKALRQVTVARLAISNPKAVP
ncbi:MULTISPECIES: DUF6285 domain-containing protein [unclassified Pseudomonas]|uniref:DUF6285 domain-containing protein n=1 Tax=unclassified Pseudomonas TaxID=196821 RepID=UPI000837B69C|nr:MULTISPECIES: DUF6285 domain-containing protein [unclassified Pseudomonas]QIH08058.1 acyl-CoA dehydrogenase [Pseudomonas sp. BIOMIG1BAC]